MMMVPVESTDRCIPYIATSSLEIDVIPRNWARIVGPLGPCLVSSPKIDGVGVKVWFIQRAASRMHAQRPRCCLTSFMLSGTLVDYMMITNSKHKFVSL